MSHRSPYEFAFEMVGGEVVHVGSSSGCTEEELVVGISERTATIAFSTHRESRGVSLKRTIEIAHAHDVPVIVNAAMAVLPRKRLSAYASKGADLVAISDGSRSRNPTTPASSAEPRSLSRWRSSKPPRSTAWEGV